MIRSLQLRALEDRMTPAGAYTSVVAGGVLTLTGTDEAEAIDILDTGAGVTIAGSAGTTIDGGASQTFTTVNSIKIVAKGGNDVVGLDGASAINLSGALDVDLGDSSGFGGNQFNLNAANTINLGSLKLKAGEGEDSVNFFGTTAIVAGDVTADLGNGNSNVSIQAGTTINGNVTVKSLLGYDELYLQGVIVGKNVSFTPGDGSSYAEISQTSTVNGDVSVFAGAGVDDLSLDGALIKGKKGVTVTGGSGSASVATVNNAVNLTLGGIAVTSKDSATSLSVGAGANLTAAGAVTLTGLNANVNADANVSAKAVTLTGTNGASFFSGANATAINVAGAVKISSKVGDADFEVDAGTLTIGGALTLAGNNTANVTLPTTGAVAITGNIGVTAKLQQAQFVATGGALTLGGNVLVTGGFGATLNLNPGAATIAGTTTVNAKAGAAFLFHSGTNNITFSKAVTVTGKDFALVSLGSTATTNVNGALKISSTSPVGGANFVMSGATVNLADSLSVSGATTFATLLPSANGSITKDVTLSGSNSLTVTSNGNLTFGKNLTVKSGNGAANVAINDSTITGNLAITTGNEADNVTLSGVSIGGLTTIKLNGGADDLSIDGGAVLTGNATIDLGIGDDSLSLGQGLNLLVNAATFTGKASIKLGAGNDSLLMGVSILAGGDLFSLVSFGAGSVIDGGANFNLFDDEDGLALGTPNIIGWTDPT